MSIIKFFALFEHEILVNNELIVFKDVVVRLKLIQDFVGFMKTIFAV